MESMLPMGVSFEIVLRIEACVCEMNRILYYRMEFHIGQATALPFAWPLRYIECDVFSQSIHLLMGI